MGLLVYFVKNILSIYSNPKKDLITAGDYYRLISYLPKLGYKKIFWFTDKKNHKYLKLSDRIDRFFLYNSKNSRNNLLKSSLIIDLFNKKKKYPNTLLLNNILDTNINIKQNTVNLFDKLDDYFNIKLKNKIFSNKSKKNNSKNYIFFNWIVPKKWEIKSYPFRDWIEIEKKINSENKNLTVIWQKKSDTMAEYLKKIKESKIILTINGFGCHAAMLLNKPQIILTGPTFFDEMKLYKKTIMIKPANYCEIRPCNLPNGIAFCGCMGFINHELVYKKILYLLSKLRK